MPVLVDHIPINIETGLHEWTANVGPQVAGLVTVKIARCTTATPTFWSDPATYIDLKMYMSTDNGKTWIYMCGCGAPGGIHVTRHGEESPETTLEMQLTKGIRVKAELNVTNGPLVSELTVEVV